LSPVFLALVFFLSLGNVFLALVVGSRLT